MGGVTDPVPSVIVPPLDGSVMEHVLAEHWMELRLEPEALLLQSSEIVVLFCLLTVLLCTCTPWCSLWASHINL